MIVVTAFPANQGPPRKNYKIEYEAKKNLVNNKNGNTPSLPIPIRPDISNEDTNDATDITRIAEEERLQKLISRAGIASRRAAEKLIVDGRVTVNGNIVTELGTKVKTRKDIVQVDGVKLNLPDSKSVLWVALHKPRGLLTTMEDDKERDTVFSLIPRARELRLLSVGRLDRDTTGLMLLTNENGWIHPLTHPSFVHRRRYEIVVQGIPTDEAVENLKSGIILPDEKIPLPSILMNIKDSDPSQGLSLLDVTMQEILPRQLQRIVEFLGCEILSMKRSEFGPIKLQGLRKGEWRELTQLEIERVKASCVKSKTALPPKPKSRSKVFNRARKPGSGYLSRGGGTGDGSGDKEQIEDNKYRPSTGRPPVRNSKDRRA